MCIGYGRKISESEKQEIAAAKKNSREGKEGKNDKKKKTGRA